jgi:hypothetical protein
VPPRRAPPPAPPRLAAAALARSPHHPRAAWVPRTVNASRACTAPSSRRRVRAAGPGVPRSRAARVRRVARALATEPARPRRAVPFDPWLRPPVTGPTSANRLGGLRAQRGMHEPLSGAAVAQRPGACDACVVGRRIRPMTRSYNPSAAQEVGPPLSGAGGGQGALSLSATVVTAARSQSDIVTCPCRCARSSMSRSAARPQSVAIASRA